MTFQPLRTPGGSCCYFLKLRKAEQLAQGPKATARIWFQRWIFFYLVLPPGVKKTRQLPSHNSPSISCPFWFLSGVSVTTPPAAQLEHQLLYPSCLHTGQVLSYLLNGRKNEVNQSKQIPWKNGGAPGCPFRLVMGGVYKLQRGKRPKSHEANHDMMVGQQLGRDFTPDSQTQPERGGPRVGSVRWSTRPAQDSRGRGMGRR